MSEVQIKRDDVLASVDERFLPDFIKDGWKELSAGEQKKLDLQKSKSDNKE